MSQHQDPDQAAELEHVGRVMREHIETMTADFAQVRSSLRSPSLETQDLVKLASLAGEVAQGTARAPKSSATLANKTCPMEEIDDAFPGYQPGATVPQELLEEVVGQFRSLGFAVVGVTQEETGRIYFDPNQSTGEFSFIL